MKTIVYNPFGNSAVIVKFHCDKCSNEVISDAIGIPNLDFSAETDRDSYNDNTESVNCENCLKEFKINVWASSVGGYLEVDYNDDRNDLICVTEIEEERDLFDDEFIELNKLDAVSLGKIMKALEVKP